MGGRCAVAIAVAVWSGLALGRDLGVGPVLACLTLVSALAGLALRAPDRVGTLAVLLCVGLSAAARGGAACAALAHGPWALRQASPPSGPDAIAPPRWIRVVLVEHPLREAEDPLAVVRLIAPAGRLPAGTRARLRMPAGCEAEWGDTVVAFATLDRPPGRANPGGLSPRAIAAGAGIAIEGRALVARTMPAGGVHAVWRATAVRWRRSVERILAARLSLEARQLVTPLVIGDRSALPVAVAADLRAAGLTHLLALSGLHVVWLALLARGLASAAGAGVRGRALAGAACALVYAAIAGPLPSLMRAVATELAAAAARFAGRALDAVQALAVSAIALLVAAPSWGEDLGFQLSCAATLGLVTIGPWLTARAGRFRAPCTPFIPTVAAQLVALPLLIDRFHALPWTSLAANLIAVPLCGLLLAAAWAAVALETALPGAGGRFFAACEALAAGMRWTAERAGHAPLALLATGSEPGVPWLAGLGAALLACALPGPRTLDAQGSPASRARITAVALGSVATALALALAITAPALRPPAGRWWLVALDVGQGDALALGFADGWWLVDAGPRTPRRDAGESVVLPFLRWAGVRRLEALALTHDDGDHTGGAEALGRGTRIERLVVPVALPAVPGPGARFRPHARVMSAARGDTLRRAPTVAVRWPPAGAALTRDNAAGLALTIAGEEGSVLLAADLDSLGEDSLGIAAPLAVLKVAHHGSGSSSGARFLARARPRLAIISCGRRNVFGHPDPGTLARLGRAGAAIARTDHEGAVWLELSATGVTRVDWRRGAPRAPADPPPALAPPPAR